MSFKAKIFILIIFLTLSLPGAAGAAPVPFPDLDISVGQTEDPVQVVESVKILLLLSLLSFIPAIIMMMTSFTRIIIVLAFLRGALGAQQAPPNQVLVGLALFLTVFIMSPVYSDINNNSIKPFMAGEMSQEAAIGAAQQPLSKFMLAQTREKDLALFLNIRKMESPATQQDVPFSVVVPAFMISELKTAFQIGFLIYIPFLVIDMVVASTLMALGMFMLPPVMISLPFKLLLFVMVDGWYLVVKSLVESFH